MTDTEAVAEEWAYAGLRFTDGSLWHAWQDPATGKIRSWTTRKRFIVGGIYVRQIERAPEAGGVKVYSYGDPEFTGKRLDDPDLVLAWEIAHESAERRAAAKTAEKRAAREGGLIDAACEPLLELARKCHTFEDVDRLVNSVRRRLYDGWGSK